MSGRKYYCTCDSNCKYETMTKEQILAAIAQAVATGSVGDCDTGFVTKLKETNGGGYITMWVGTREQYEKIEKKAPNCIYVISNDTTTDDIWNALNNMRVDVDEAMRLCAGRAPWELVTLKNVAFSTMEELDVYVQNVASSVAMYSVTLISCRLDMDDYNCGGQITIHKGADCDGIASVRVCFQTTDGTAMQRYAWSDGAESQLNWDAWEYITPPMKNGVEYRTAERHDGKPVYAWTGSAAMGYIGETETLTITTDITDSMQVLSIDAVITNLAKNYPWSPLPFFAYSGAVAAVCDVTSEWMNGTRALMANLRSLDDMTGYTATVTVKYTK